MRKLSDRAARELAAAGISQSTIDELMGDFRQHAALRELGDVVGPHGSIGRVQAGGVRIDKGGIGVFENGVLKTTILPDGNFKVGTDISDPALTTFCLFVNDQAYNGENLGAGDMLVGDNSAANMLYDASAGRLKFREGTTVQAFVDTDGVLKAGGGNIQLSDSGIAILEGDSGQAFLSFYDTTGATEQFAFKVASGDMTWQSEQVGGEFNITLKLTNGNTPYIKWMEGGTANTTHLEVNAGSAGGDAIFFNDVTVDGTEHRLEVGADHYFPTRSASNPNTYINEANQDMDTFIRSTGDDNTLVVNAGTDRVGIGTNSPGSKLDVAGSFQCDSITNDTGLAAGTYTPTLTDVANLDSSTVNGDLMYIRVGNIVQVTGSVIVDPTAAGGTVTRLGISLPVASDLTASTQLAGTGNDRTNSQIANYNGDTTNNRAEMVFPALVTGSSTFRFTFAYPIV